ncbi:MAG: FecR domain-containing protein [Bacteroides sp.]|nr:FecR domain-containing protein [Bacteroides sp.]
MMTVNEDYFIKYLKNELTEEETRQLLAWLRENKDNQEFLFSLKDSFLYLNYEKDKKEADTEKEWKKFLKRVEGEPQPKPSAKHFSLKYVWTSAAVILLCIVGGWIAGSAYTGLDTPRGLVTLETETGQQAKTVLPDGTTVLLNACSKLTYSLEGWNHARDVRLEGEAIFDVVHKKDQPFYVHTDNYNVRVLGTNFNVLAYGDDPEGVVTLKHGKVEIDMAGSNKNLFLQPGESFVYDNRAGTYRVEQRSLKHIYAWEHNEIIFEGHTLEEKKEKLTRHFGYKFEIAPELQKMSYKATLRDESLNEFLAALDSITPQMSYRIDANRKIVKVGE